MATEKFVDSKFLSNLLSGSFEVAMGAVEEAVSENASLFGGNDAVQVKVIGTYPDHVLVANTQAGFFRAEWTPSDDGEITLSAVKQIQVPVVERDGTSAQARSLSLDAVDAIFECKDDEAEERLRALLDLVSSGVALTAEAVEDVYTEQRKGFAASEWHTALIERKDGIRAFLGAEVHRLDSVKPQFGHLTAESVEDEFADRHRGAVVQGLRSIKESIQKMIEQTKDAKRIDATYRIHGGAEDSIVEVAEFVDFVSGFSEDLDAMMAIVDDSMAVSEDGCVKCLARLHDGIVSEMTEWALAAAFVAKLARRFEAPQAA